MNDGHFSFFYKFCQSAFSLQSTGSEVDRHILSMMTESSIDFTSKFAKLANAVVNNDSAVTNDSNAVTERNSKPGDPADD